MTKPDDPSWAVSVFRPDGRRVYLIGGIRSEERAMRSGAEWQMVLAGLQALGAEVVVTDPDGREYSRVVIDSW